MRRRAATSCAWCLACALLVGCKSASAEHPAIAECDDYIDFYEHCAGKLAGDGELVRSQVASVRASFSLADGATDSDRDALKARCVAAKQSLERTCQ